MGSRYPLEREKNGIHHHGEKNQKERIRTGALKESWRNFMIAINLKKKGKKKIPIIFFSDLRPGYSGWQSAPQGWIMTGTALVPQQPYSDYSAQTKKELNIIRRIGREA